MIASGGVFWRKDRQQLTGGSPASRISIRDVQHYTIASPIGIRRRLAREWSVARPRTPLRNSAFADNDTPADAGKRLEAFRGSYANAQEANTLAAECYEVLLAGQAGSSEAGGRQSNQASKKVLHLLDMAAMASAITSGPTELSTCSALISLPCSVGMRKLALGLREVAAKSRRTRSSTCFWPDWRRTAWGS